MKVYTVWYIGSTRTEAMLEGIFSTMEKAKYAQAELKELNYTTWIDEVEVQ